MGKCSSAKANEGASIVNSEEEKIIVPSFR